ncbi:MAG: hypothetical protein D3925_10475, partial [Candidatus Electrothrix sp. AR5]|nr:hypothetical protein [Candidatus Electrothrix sp. AR5]
MPLKKITLFVLLLALTACSETPKVMMEEARPARSVLMTKAPQSQPEWNTESYNAQEENKNQT